MAQLIDLEEIYKLVAARKAKLETELSGDTEHAVIARYEYATAEAITVWRCKEINLGTDRHHLIKALMMGAVASLSGHIMQDVLDPDKREIAAIGICREMLFDIVDILSATPEEQQRYSHIVKATEAGIA